MNVLFGVLKFLYLLSSALLVIMVLLQAGKGGGLAAAFGGGGGVDSAFGAKVGGPMRKATALFAGLFLALAIVLAVIRSTRPDALVEDEQIGPAPSAQEEPAEDEGALLREQHGPTGVA